MKAKGWPMVSRLCDKCGSNHRIEDWRVGTDSEFICLGCMDKEHNKSTSLASQRRLHQHKLRLLGDER